MKKLCSVREQSNARITRSYHSGALTHKMCVTILLWINEYFYIYKYQLERVPSRVSGWNSVQSLWASCIEDCKGRWGMISVVHDDYLQQFLVDSIRRSILNSPKKDMHFQCQSQNMLLRWQREQEEEAADPWDCKILLFLFTWAKKQHSFNDATSFELLLYTIRAIYLKFKHII